MRKPGSRRLFGHWCAALSQGHLWAEPAVLNLVMSKDNAGSPEESCLLFHTFSLLLGKLRVTEAAHLSRLHLPCFPMSHVRVLHRNGRPP